MLRHPEPCDELDSVLFQESYVLALTIKFGCKYNRSPTKIPKRVRNDPFGTPQNLKDLLV